eukprot:TRINITY_DN5329_c0_g1_i1.p1 TRINITY_DN5329_c0_g1~~TRINITY_DN5329_c0_g1_i1.p1  ORF type:complete len:735 (-),score=158.45 TRINITY_DN5329_c0_g1_i1:81-2156(-)
MAELENYYDDVDAAEGSFWHNVMPTHSPQQGGAAPAGPAVPKLAIPESASGHVLQVEPATASSAHSGSGTSVHSEVYYEGGEHAAELMRMELAKVKMRGALRVKKLRFWNTFRFKTTSAMFLLILVVLAVLVSVIFTIYARSVKDFEVAAGKKNVEQAVSLIGSSLSTLRNQAVTWCCWDDARFWMVSNDPNGDFWKAYFSIDQSPYFNANALIYVTLDSKVFAYQAFDYTKQGATTLPQNLLDTVVGLAGDLYVGLISDETNSWVYEMVSVPVLFTNCSGDPAGYYVVLREPSIDVKYAVTLCPLCVSAYATSSVPEQFKSQAKSLSKGDTVKLEPHIFTLDGEKVSIKLGVSRSSNMSCADYMSNREHNLISASVVIADQEGRPSLLLVTYGNRYLHSISRQSFTSQGVAFAVICFVFLLFTVLFMEFFVTRRVTSLVRAINKLTTCKNFANRITTRGRDELQLIAESVNFMLDQVESEQQKTNLILYNTFPKDVVQRLKDGVEISDYYPETTVLFADICNFTEWSSKRSPTRVVQVLNHMFSAIDLATSRSGVTKVKTIGDAYLAVAGIPEQKPDHAALVVNLGLIIVRIVRQVAIKEGEPLEVRVGVHSGPISTGVLGLHRFIWDVWGDTVNTSSRLQSSSAPGAVHCSAATYELCQNDFVFDGPHTVELKGKGTQTAYFAVARKHW